MQIKFIDSEYTGVKTIDDAWDYTPWAATIVDAEGGFIAFESLDDFKTWSNQK